MVRLRDAQPEPDGGGAAQFGSGWGSDEFPSRLAMGVRASTLGAGIEFASPVTRRTNIRVGFNALDYSRGFTKDGISYAGSLRLRSVEAHLDWFPFSGSFHLSPGWLIYNGNRVTANAFVPGGQTFTLGNGTYASSPNDPLVGVGRFDVVRTVAPTIMMGWGNLLPRNGRHFSVPFEFGVIYQEAPRIALAFAGSACDVGGANCRSVLTDPTIQSNILAEQTKLKDKVGLYGFYPVVSIGFAFRF